jgi:hypothetical protein
MNYFNYDIKIVSELGRKLVGWPAKVKFANPSEIGTVSEIRTLRDALRSGECHWVKLTKSQIEGHKADLESRREAGQTVGKPRKKRSDAGTKRKRPSENQENEEPEAGPPTNRTKKSKGKQKSVAFIESSDDSDSGSD